MKREDFVNKGTRFKAKNYILNSIINNVFTIVLRNWMFQGFFDLSINEKIYKILFDLIFIFSALFCGIESKSWLLLILIIAHTINWVTNDHFVDNLYHLHVCETTPEKMEEAILFLQKYVNRYDSIVFAGIYGRIARGDEVHKGTDIDIRLIKGGGVMSNIYVCFIGHALRFMALIKLIPIDLNIWNNKQDLNRMRKDENPLVLKDIKRISVIYDQMPNSMLARYKKYDVRFSK